jgi:hypothetical protein
MNTPSTTQFEPAKLQPIVPQDVADWIRIEAVRRRLSQGELIAEIVREKMAQDKAA